MPHPDLTLPENRNLTPEERKSAAMNTWMTSPEKLIQWLEASGRTWIVFNARQFVEAQAWPSGAEAFQYLLAAYRDHRSTIPTGETETIAGKTVNKFHTESLTVIELDRVIRYLISQASTLDPTWSLERDPA